MPTIQGELIPSMFGTPYPAELQYQISMLVPPSTQPLEECENKCSMNGICVNRTCYCERGYVGKDCAIFTQHQLTANDATYKTLALYSLTSCGAGLIVGHYNLFILWLKSNIRFNYNYVCNQEDWRNRIYEYSSKIRKVIRMI